MNGGDTVEGKCSVRTGNVEIASTGLELDGSVSGYCKDEIKTVSQNGNPSIVYKVIKRCFDVVFSLIALIILSPVFLFTAIAIKLEDGGPVIHKRYCVGYRKKIFPMYKFRSMVVNADELIENFPDDLKEQYLKGIKLKNDPRITRVGKFIRKTSIDELPQLLNVLKGNMSIIGPRPVIERELCAYGDYSDYLLSVRPGITGTWQVYARGEVAYLSEESRSMQLDYVKNSSFIYDVKIFLLTFWRIIFRGGAR